MTVSPPMLGERFGRLTVYGDAPSDRHGRARYRVVCDCDSLLIVAGWKLRGGRTLSCGCLRRDVARSLVPPRYFAPRSRLEHATSRLERALEHA